MDTFKQKAKQIIAENIYCTIATASRDGKPWISPVFFAYDKTYNLYWISEKNSRHSALIRSNSSIAIVIFNSQAPEGEGDGVYMEANAYELSDEKEITHATTILNKRITKDQFRINDIQHVRGNAAWRIYKAVLQKTYKLSDGKYINGQYVDRLKEVKF